MSRSFLSGHPDRPSAGRHRRLTIAAIGIGAALTLAACGSSSSSSAGGSSSSGGSSGKNVKVALILKTFSNPYFVSMENSAKSDASTRGVNLTVTAGTTDGDTATQISAIDNAIAAGDAGIVITPNGNAVNSALQKARTAGLYTIALDTAPIPPSTVNLTYATDNTQAGRLDGQWAAAKLTGKPADIALLDLFNNQVVSVDVDRDHGFLQGMGIPVGDATINGKEPASGKYSGGKGGTYKIACQLPTQGAIPQGKSAMQTCLQKDPNINLVYAINEPAAQGAAQALAAAHSKALVVAIDGGCTNLPYVSNGSIAATAGQFPGKMASDGVTAIYDLVTKHVHPAASPGLGFFNTGTTLYTNDPMPGVSSLTVAAAKKICWG
jgi:fructose transport system substrate-binding protein